MSELTKYSDGQPQLANQLSVGQPAHISGTIQHTKTADQLLERVWKKENETFFSHFALGPDIEFKFLLFFLPQTYSHFYVKMRFGHLILGADNQLFQSGCPQDNQ